MTTDKRINNLEKIVILDQASKWYPPNYGLNLINKEKSWIKAVDQVSLQIGKGEILGIIGESGCGKSTLGRMIAMLEKSTSGDIMINGESIESLTLRNNKKLRRSVQIIFQNPFDTFNPRDTVERIMTRPLQIHQIGLSHNERRKMCLRILESGGFKSIEALMDKYPHELSGGELQRLSILRSLMIEPSLIIADEPVSMLDASIRADIVNLLIGLSKDKETAVVFISHDLNITRQISDKIAVMYMGRIVEYGHKDEILKNSKHPYTKMLMNYSLSINPDSSFKRTVNSGVDSVQTRRGCYFAPRCYKAIQNCHNKYPADHDVGEGHLVACDRIHMDLGR